MRDELVIDFQNENLVAQRAGQTLCSVPDLISLLTLEEGEPVGTEALRYGLRVAVLAMPAARELKDARRAGYCRAGRLWLPRCRLSTATRGLTLITF